MDSTATTFNPNIEELMATALKIHDGNRTKTAAEVDARIRGNARHFVQFGIDLMLMRDGQLYRDLPGCSAMSFEEYVDSVEELSARHAERVIKSSLVYQAISMGDPEGRPSILPATEKHCRALIDSGRAAFKVDKREAVTAKGERKVIAQPVAVANVEKVVKDWEKVVKTHEKESAKFVKENPGKRPKKISYMFIRKQFPGGEKVARSLDDSLFDRLGRNLAKWKDTLEGYRAKHKKDVRKLIKDEGWTEQHMDGIHDMLADLSYEINQWIEGLTK